MPVEMRTPKSIAPYIFFLIMSFIVLWADSRNFFHSLRTAGQKIIVPLRQKFLNLRQIQLSFVSDQALSRTQKDDKILALEAKIALLEEENKKIRRLLGADLPPSWQFRPAKIVGWFGDEAEIFVDSPPPVGSVVVDSKEKTGVYLGKVAQIYGKTANVILPSNKQSRIPVEVRGTDGSHHAVGLLKGEGGTALLDQVLTKEVLEEGDLVLTSGKAGYPSGLLIGRVDKLLKPKQKSILQAKVKLVASELWTGTVFVVIKY